MLSYLLIAAEPEAQPEIKRKLSQYEVTVNGVEELDDSFSILARVVTDDRKALKLFIQEQLNTMDGIKSIENYAF